MKSRNNIIKGLLILIYSMTLLFILVNSFSGRTEDHWTFFYTFTQQSNILVLIWFVALGSYLITGNDKLKFSKNRVLMTALTVYVSITYFIVALVLNPIYTGSFNPVSDGNELWLHHLTPFMAWIVFAIIPGEGELTVKKALASLIYPILYVVLNLIVGATTTYSNGDKAYAYDFINPTASGMYGGNILIFIIAITFLILVFSLFTVGLTKFKIFIDGTLEEQNN